MIQAIKELGELKLKKESRDTYNLLSILVQNPNQAQRYPFVLIIVFDIKENRLSYRGIHLEETSKNKVINYLYRRAASQGANYTP
ncbi:MAG: TM1802 family CRISPR-associated protein, partial [Elusimicrobiales bacterium]